MVCEIFISLHPLLSDGTSGFIRNIDEKGFNIKGDHSFVNPDWTGDIGNQRAMPII